ncbi:MAG: hypothetical protein J5598_02260 [Clostridia bacterium]|nr:hypothetical protein [Clostridia bacterium]
MARRKIKDLNPVSTCKANGVYSRFDEYFNLLMNAVKVVSAQGEEAINYETETFLKRGLFENGAMGYDKLTKQWYYVYGQGLNKFGNPTSLIFVTANGKTFERKAYYENEEDGAYKVDALPINMSMSQLIKATTDFMTNCEVAMKQNLEACKTPYIVVCKDEKLRLSFETALQQKVLGQACIVVSEDLGDGLKAVDIGVTYLVDKFAEARDTERDTLLNKLGILTANTDKKERVQSAEVNASLGQASDYIYMLIDNFNKQCDSYGLPFKMTFNGSMEEIYLQDVDGDGDIDVNDIEKGQQIQ